LNENLKILVVNDNSALNELLNTVLGEIPGVILTDTAATISAGKTSLQKNTVDLVLLNIDMPGKNGFSLLKEIKSVYVDIEVVTMGKPGSFTMEKIEQVILMGALEHITVFAGESDPKEITLLRRRLFTLLGLVKNRKNARAANIFLPVKPVVPKRPAHLQEQAHMAPVRQSAESVFSRLQSMEKHRIPGKISIITMASSTGGPNALLEVLHGLPVNIGVPILLVQHMPPNMTSPLADALSKKTFLPVREGVDGEPILPGTIYIAPGGRHMVVRSEKSLADKPFLKNIGLTDDPPENSVRPAADVLFRSIAAHYDGNILCVIMTGMGSDGMAGVSVMKQKSCYCLTQSEDTCVVYGMPKAVVDANLSDEKVPLDGLSHRIIDIVTKRSF
jgi:two-component system, chemotaxis family, protein-glutamate methylesterase/glutaminase